MSIRGCQSGSEQAKQCGPTSNIRIPVNEEAHESRPPTPFPFVALNVDVPSTRRVNINSRKQFISTDDNNRKNECGKRAERERASEPISHIHGIISNNNAYVRLFSVFLLSPKTTNYESLTPAQPHAHSYSVLTVCLPDGNVCSSADFEFLTKCCGAHAAAAIGPSDFPAGSHKDELPERAFLLFSAV